MTTRCQVSLGLVVLFVAVCGTSFVLGQAPAPGPLLTRPTSGAFRMLLDASQIGGSQVSVGERTYPAGYESGEHSHQSIEVLYVLSGEFHHVVNGQTHVLTQGMLGFVRPDDVVRHKTGPGSGAKVLMIWVPGTDGTNLAERWQGSAPQ